MTSHSLFFNNKSGKLYHMYIPRINNSQSLSGQSSMKICFCFFFFLKSTSTDLIQLSTFHLQYSTWFTVNHWKKILSVYVERISRTMKEIWMNSCASREITIYLLSLLNLSPLFCHICEIFLSRVLRTFFFFRIKVIIGDFRCTLDSFTV